MPVSHSTLTGLFSDIADAIRSKTGSNGLITADAFPAAINSIPTGGGGNEFYSIFDRTISGEFQNNIPVVGSYAFAFCSKLTSISLSSCVDIAGTSAFYKCSNLQYAYFEKCSHIGPNTFSSCSFLKTISFPLCSNIDEYAFAYCYSLDNVSFPLLRYIGYYGFAYCTFSEISIPLIRTIGQYAFRKCLNLKSISASLCTELSANAFDECQSLSLVYLRSCIAIGSSAFRSCYNLLSLYLLCSSVPNLTNTNAFLSTPISSYTASTGGTYGSIIVYESMLNKFISGYNWSKYSNRFSVYNGTD